MRAAAVKRLTAISATVALAGAVAASPAAAFEFLRGFGAAPGAASAGVDMARMRAAGADVVRVNAEWSSIAPARRPARFHPSDPMDPAYDWWRTDAAVEAAAGQHLRVLLDVTGAPRWAEGRDRPAAVAAGAWRPSAREFGRFMLAAARRYSGAYVGLPRVRWWQLWDEPNLSVYLAPQWSGRPHAWTPASPTAYRALLNAGYAAVKRVAADNLVVAAGTAPYGDPAGGPRMAPVRFARSLFCLDREPARCSSRAHLDALDHHPYSVAGPFVATGSPADVTVPDLARLRRVYRAAERAGEIAPAGPKPLWATELAWDSSPPDPAGVPLARWRRWIEEAYFELWLERVQVALWLQVSDPVAPVASLDNIYLCGAFTAGGLPKPGAIEAFRFPFVVEPVWHRGHRRMLVWTRPSRPGTVTVERRAGARWRTLLRLRAPVGSAVVTTLPASGPAVLRAVDGGGEASLPWREAP